MQLRRLNERGKRVKPDADQIRRDVAEAKGLSLDEYETASDGGDLKPGFKLIFPDDTEVDVAGILKESMKAYLEDEELEGKEIQHPIEHGLDEKTMLFYNTNTGVPRIHSFAHGGQVWTLKDDGSVIEELSQSYAHLNHSMKLLRTRHGIKASDKRSIKLPKHPETDNVFRLMLKTFVQTEA